jgi:hypothetical protein
MQPGGSGTVTIFSFAGGERATVYELPPEQLRVRHLPHVTMAWRSLRRRCGTPSAAAPPRLRCCEDCFRAGHQDTFGAWVRLTHFRRIDAPNTECVFFVGAAVLARG